MNRPLKLVIYVNANRASETTCGECEYRALTPESATGLRCELFGKPLQQETRRPWQVLRREECIAAEEDARKAGHG